MFSWPPYSWWLIIGPFINTTTQNPPLCFLQSAPVFPHFSSGAPSYACQKGEQSFPSGSKQAPQSSKWQPSSIHILHLNLKQRQEKIKWHRPHRVGGRECDPTWLFSLYSKWWQSALWLCSVRWALRLKPYTGKAPLWPWLVKCSHQEGASVQWLLRAAKLLLEIKM